MRNCAWPRCPRLIPAGKQQYCDEHRKTYDHERGSATERGYGKGHARVRAAWDKAMQAGAVPTCPRCGHPIRPGQAWDLDHDDSRKGWLGPAHSGCNRAAGGKHSVQMRERFER